MSLNSPSFEPKPQLVLSDAQKIVLEELNRHLINLNPEQIEALLKRRKDGSVDLRGKDFANLLMRCGVWENYFNLKTYTDVQMGVRSMPGEDGLVSLLLPKVDMGASTCQDAQFIGKWPDSGNILSLTADGVSAGIFSGWMAREMVNELVQSLASELNDIDIFADLNLIMWRINTLVIAALNKVRAKYEKEIEPLFSELYCSVNRCDNISRDLKSALQQEVIDGSGSTTLQITFEDFARKSLITWQLGDGVIGLLKENNQPPILWHIGKHYQANTPAQVCLVDFGDEYWQTFLDLHAVMHCFDLTDVAGYFSGTDGAIGAVGAHLNQVLQKWLSEGCQNKATEVGAQIAAVAKPVADDDLALALRCFDKAKTDPSL